MAREESSHSGEAGVFSFTPSSLPHAISTCPCHQERFSLLLLGDTPRGTQGHRLLAVDIFFWDSLGLPSQMSALGNVGHGAQDCGGVHFETENM